MPSAPQQIRPQEMPHRDREQSPYTFFDQAFEDYFDLYGTLTPTVLGSQRG